MSLVTVNGTPCVRATVRIPRLGVWIADVAVDVAKTISGPVTVSVSDGALELKGRAARTGVFKDTAILRVLGGAGGLATEVPAKFYRRCPAKVPLSGVKPNTDYALVLTTPGGLARYVLEDVVRFVSTEPPRLLYVGRTTLRLNSFGEQVMEKELTDALAAVCTRQKWSLVNFHVAPLPPGKTTTGPVRGRHEWWIELKPGTIATPIGPQIAAELEIELTRANPTYAARRRGNVLDGPVVRLVMPGVFEHWLRYQGRWGGQHKLPRCRSDRLIADELAQITNFAQD